MDQQVGGSRGRWIGGHHCSGGSRESLAAAVVVVVVLLLLLTVRDRSRRLEGKLQTVTYDPLT